MLCDEFDVRLQRLLDLRKSPEQDRQLRQHAQLCASCREELSIVGRLLDGLDLLETPQLSDDFAQRVVEQVVRVMPPHHRAPRLTLVVALAVAATLIIAALPAIWLPSDIGQQRAASSPSGSPASVEIAYAPPAAADTDSGTSSDLGWWMVPPERILELYTKEARERHRQQVHEIAHDLRPIATPFNAAVEAIYRTLPVGRPRDKGQPRASITPVNLSGNWS